MYRLITWVMLIMVLAIPAGITGVRAADKPVTSSGDLQFAVDYCVFDERPDGTNYVEFYIMLYAQGLEPDSVNGQAIGLARIETKISDEKGLTQKVHNWVMEANLPGDPELLKIMSVYDQWAEIIPAGGYKCRIDIYDQISGRQGIAEMKFEVPVRTSPGISASQLEFVSRIEAKRAGSPFVKGNRLIYPNPERRYGILNPNLMVYYELYGLDSFEADRIDIFYEVRDKFDKVVQVFPTGGVRKAGNSVAVTHAFDVSTVASGIYMLFVNMRQDSGTVQTLQSRMFEVVQAEQLTQKNELTEEEINIAGNQIKYFATPREYEMYQNLDTLGKTRFLIRFWKDRDPDADTEINEFFVRVQQRYQFANDKYGWLGKSGWETDRGRVLIVYGMPDDIIRNTFEEQAIAHEIWHYDQPRRYEFVFVDYRSTGNYILVHSTMEGEVHDENWENTVQR